MATLRLSRAHTNEHSGDGGGMAATRAAVTRLPSQKPGRAPRTCIAEGQQGLSRGRGRTPVARARASRVAHGYAEPRPRHPEESTAGNASGINQTNEHGTQTGEVRRPPPPAGIELGRPRLHGLHPNTAALLVETGASTDHGARRDARTRSTRGGRDEDRRGVSPGGWPAGDGGGHRGGPS